MTWGKRTPVSNGIGTDLEDLEINLEENDFIDTERCDIALNVNSEVTANWGAGSG